MMTIDVKQFDKLPSELRNLKLWCVYDKNGFYNPETNCILDTTNLHHTDFKAMSICVSSVMQKKYDGIAFLISAKYQYATIEMKSIEDDYERSIKFSEIIKKFNSYTETSDDGFTIICKGSVKYNHESKYINISNQNYIQKITGNIISKNSDIIEAQSYLSQLWTECTHANNDLPEKVFDKIEEKETDEEIIRNINDSDDFDTFSRLYNGDWFRKFNSESDAKIRLVEIISTHSKYKVKTQIMRIFGESELGKDSNQVVEKIVEKAVNKAPDLVEKFHLESTKISEPEKPQVVEWPKGRLGILAKYCYESSNRPNMLVSLMAALTIPLGFCSRNFLVNGNALNAYFLLLGNTGIGKDDLKKCRGRLHEAMERYLGNEMEKFEGTSNFASGEGIIAHATRKSKCFMSIVSEFSGILKKISKINRTSAEESLSLLLLNFYDYGSQKVAGVTYSKAKDDIPPIDRPCMTIFGESNAKSIYDNLNDNMISSGLLPRLIIVETKDLRQYNNENAYSIDIPQDLLKFLVSLAKFCIDCNNSDIKIKIQLDEEAKKRIREIDIITTDEINKDPKNQGVTQIYNRVQVKCFKIAGLLAIFDCEMDSSGEYDFSSPIINLKHVQYAENFIMASSKNIADKYNKGEIGFTENDEKRYMLEIIGIIEEYNNSEFKKLISYQCNELAHNKKLCGYAYILKKGMQRSIFKNHRLGATQAIKNILKILVEHGDIKIIDYTEMNRIGLKGKGQYYKINDFFG